MDGASIELGSSVEVVGATTGVVGSLGVASLGTGAELLAEIV